MCTFWPHATMFLNGVYPGKSLKNAFLSPSVPRGANFLCLGLTISSHSFFVRRVTVYQHDLSGCRCNRFTDVCVSDKLKDCMKQHQASLVAGGNNTHRLSLDVLSNSALCSHSCCCCCCYYYCYYFRVVLWNISSSSCWRMLVAEAKIGHPD